MDEFKPNLEPGNSDGHSVLRYLMEVRQMPLEFAIEKVQQAVSKFAQNYKADRQKLMGGMVTAVVLGAPIFFPLGIPSVLLVGSVIGSAVGWQEMAAKRDRLKPEYDCLKGSMLLQQFIKWLAEQLKERSAQAMVEGNPFQSDLITPANILAAYEHTILAVTNGEHLDNNASDPILALFVAKLRQHTNHLPDWVMVAFRQLELAEVERAAHLNQVQAYMWGPPPAQNIGSNTRLGTVDVPAQPVEGEHSLGKPRLNLPPARRTIEERTQAVRRISPFDRKRILNESKGLMVIGDMGAAKTCVAQYIANGFDGYGIIVFDPHGMTDWGNAYVVTKMGAIYEQMRILLDLLENGDTTPLLVICDEWLEIRGDRRNKKGSEYAGLADDFIRLFSTKPRKFNKLAAFVLHSPNVEAAGVDSFLRENYLKIYLGRLAKKAFPDIQDCAYPCILEDEQQEHPTHGHHTEFKPKGKAPRNLEPLQSAPINIPLAYMKGSEVRICDRGWADGQLRLDLKNIRQRLELLFDSSAPEPNPEPLKHGPEPDSSAPEPDSSAPEPDSSAPEPDSSAQANPEPLNRDSEPLNQPTDEGCTDLEDGSQFSSGDSSERFTPLNLTKKQVLALVQNLNAELNQTQIIERLWQVKKGGSAAWKEAREQFKQLTGE